MSLKIRICVYALFPVMAISAICGAHSAFGQQNSEKQKKTASAKEGYNKGDRLTDERMSTRGLHPPQDKKKAKPKNKTAPKVKQPSKES